MPYFLGADLGGTKTHMLIADQDGQAAGFVEIGPGNHQSVGYEGTREILQSGVQLVLAHAGLDISQINGASFGIAGYDWPSHMPIMLSMIDELGMQAPYSIHNDAIPGLVAGAEDGWGVSVVSGTGCNCWGWDRQRTREGRVTGFGIMMGEGAGATEVVYRAMQMIGYAWTQRGTKTVLSELFVQAAGAKSLDDLLEGYTEFRYHLSPQTARLVIQAAGEGDQVAQEIIAWAGRELGELACAVIRQLEFEDMAFEVVLAGSMFESGPALIEPMRQTTEKIAPLVKLVRLAIPPVIGAVLIGMEQGGLENTQFTRHNMARSLAVLRQAQVHQTLSGNAVL
jgi:N-acetylglucosamine kinase-like BadF-type ATPase